jgi:hypothetical protein
VDRRYRGGAGRGRGPAEAPAARRELRVFLSDATDELCAPGWRLFAAARLMWSLVLPWLGGRSCAAFPPLVCDALVAWCRCSADGPRTRPSPRLRRCERRAHLRRDPAIKAGTLAFDDASAFAAEGLDADGNGTPMEEPSRWPRSTSSPWPTSPISPNHFTIGGKEQAFLPPSIGWNMTVAAHAVLHAAARPSRRRRPPPRSSIRNTLSLHVPGRAAAEAHWRARRVHGDYHPPQGLDPQTMASTRCRWTRGRRRTSRPPPTAPTSSPSTACHRSAGPRPRRRHRGWPARVCSGSRRRTAAARACPAGPLEPVFG